MKNYIDKNRTAFDRGTLPEGHRSRFAARLEATSETEASVTIPLRKLWIAAAAALILLLALPTAVYHFAQQNQGEEPGIESTILTELSDMEIYYGGKVRKEITQLKDLDWENYDFAFALKQELENLEAENKALKDDILTEGRNEYLIEAMIQNYQQRLIILQRISKIIQQTKIDHESDSKIST